MRRIAPILSTLACACLTAPQLEPPAWSQETRTLWVAHRRVDCIGVVPQKCYLIKDTQYEDWRFWYGEIEGFDFEEGFAYELRVLERQVEDPPADAPSTRLELIEIVVKVEADEATEPSATAPAAPPGAPEVNPPAAPQPPPPPARSVPDRVEPASNTTAAEPSSSQPSPAHRGHLIIGAGVEARSFKLCGADKGIWVEDRTGGDLWGLYRRLASYPNRPVFMEVIGELVDAPEEGFGAHFEQQLLVTAVRSASVESAGCFAEPSAFAFRASGNEPFWSLEISRRGLSFTEMGQDGKVLFPYSPPTFFGEQIIYRSQIRGQEPRSLVVRLEQQSCIDSMADATFSFSAQVTIDERELHGCALEGEAKP